MNGLVLLIISVAALLAGYVFYGRWLCKQWGVGEQSEATPAHTMEDGVDYVPAPAPILMGHHFSSIAGAGPITGPINAVAYGFGWLACTLWIIIGGIFFGGVHDFGALIASVRHGGRSIGEIISANMSKRAKRLFIIFAYLTLILVVAAFASIVAGTFGATYTEAGAVDMAASLSQARVAMVSILFIVIAIAFGFLVYRRGAPMGVASVVGVLAIVAIIVIGMNFHPLYLSTNTWMWIVGLYIIIASVTPVWILLQPRDYLSSFLLYAMLALAVVAVVVAHPTMDSLPLMQSAEPQYPVFPVLFTTIACGAISGFHSLVSSGTTSKQLDKETDAKPIAYGGMLLECVLAILTLCAVAYAYSWNAEHPEAALKGATAIFGGGIAGMIDPFHLEAYGKTAVNYNRDIEIFPVVHAIFELIAGQSPYQSPTDMGVNMAGNCIVDDQVCREASLKEIERRYLKCLCQQKSGAPIREEERFKLELLLNQAGITLGSRAVEQQAHARSQATGGLPAAAIELADGTIVTGKTGPLLGAASSALLNALKYLAGIGQEIDLVSARAIEPIQMLKTTYLGNKNPRLHTDEILIALSSSIADNACAAAALKQLPLLKGCDVHSTVILSSVDSDTLNKLGMYLTCDPVYEEEDRKYHKK